MKVLVIGGSGFTGQRILVACPSSWSVLGLARSRQAEATIRNLGVSPVNGDLDESASIAAALGAVQPDAVICAASLGFGHAPSLVSAIAEHAPEARCIFMSTTGIFTKLQPATKSVRIEAERVIGHAEIDATIVRPTMIYGRPGDRNMERLLRWMARFPVVTAPDGGRSLQQPVHVDDLAATIVGAVECHAARGRAFDVPGPVPLSFREVVETAGSTVGRRARVLDLPTRILRLGVGAQSRLLPSPRLSVEQIDRLTEDKVFDVSPAREVLGHEPRSFDEGLAEEYRLLRGTR